MNFFTFTGRFCFVLLITVLFSHPLYAQQESIEYGAGSNVAASLSSEDLPFWFYANRGGTVDQQSTNFTNRFFSKYTYHNSARSFRLNTGLEGIARLSQHNSFHFTELYGTVGYSVLNLKAGRFHYPVGLNNHELSAGGMMMSKNAIPLPRIMIYSPDFVDVPYTDELVEVKGMYSHGWFTEDRYVEDPYLHQKYFYLKINIGPFSGTGGIVHNAVWAGTSPDHGRLPQSFGNYLNVVMGKGASDDSDAPPGEKSNVVGNSLGAYEFKANYSFDFFSFSLTRLFYLEDGVSRRFRSPWDGVWGANFKMNDSNNFISAITYEHINTKQQDAKPTQELGQANYYNHGIYRNGWANYGQPMGLSLMTYDEQSNRFYNNIIVGHHVGIKGQFTNYLSYKFLSSYTRNYGTGSAAKNQPPGTIDFSERREDQYSFLLDINYTLPQVDGLSLNVSTALDTGEFYGDNNLGFQMGIRWSRIAN